MSVFVSKLRDHVSMAPEPGEIEACARAAPWCWAGSILATSSSWTFGCRRDVGHALLVAEYADAHAIPWRHLLSVRVDLACDEGVGCAIPPEWLRRLPAELVHDALRAWTGAGYEIRLGYELDGGSVQSRRDWIQRAMAAKGKGLELAYYARAEERDGRRILWLQAVGLDLRHGDVRRFLAERLRSHRAASRTVFGLATDLHVGIKSGQLERAGSWRYAPGADVAGPCYLVGGLYELDELGAYYREILAGLGDASVVTNENPRHLERGALWGGLIPAEIAGDAVSA